MELINKKIIAFFLFFFLFAAELTAQITPVPGQLGNEILGIEQFLLRPGLSSAERYNALARLARLRQLSGDISGAASSWLEAAAVDPVNENARVSGAFCLAAAGEWESAVLLIQPVVLYGRNWQSVLQARYLDACLKTWINADASPLVFLASNPEFINIRPMIYYAIWRSLLRNPATSGAVVTSSAGISGGADFWKSRLLAEFPGSMEARVAAAENDITGSASGSFSVSAIHSPIWLLFPSAPSSAAAPVQPQAVPMPQALTLPQAVPLPQTVTPPAQIPQPQTVSSQAMSSQSMLPQQPAAAQQAVQPVPSAGIYLQTGAFSREVNARTEAEKMQKAGFPAVVSRKNVNNSDLWVVTVPAGQDANKTMQDLKKSGWDSFIVR